MKQISDKEYEKYQQYRTEKLHGRILTPDGLRVVCAGLDNDPEKLKAEGYTEDQIARAMHEKRRELGRQYKEAGLVTKFKFYAVRMMQTGLGKADPEYTDYKYWKGNGWIDKKRPWQ